MNKIFLPLRSNAAWFTAEKTRSRLEKRIKNYLVLYDTVFIQDGRYNCTIGESGGIDVVISPNNTELDRTKIQYFKPGKRFSLIIKTNGSKQNQTLMEGKVEVQFEVDFYPILHNAGLLSADYVKWLDIDLKQKYKNLAQSIANIDERNEKVKKFLPNNYFQRKNILQSLYIDSQLAFNLNMPFLVDDNILSVIRWKNEQAKNRWQPALRDIFYNLWLSFEHPDFGQLSWKEVHELRESAAGRDYRRMIQRICNAIQDSLPDLKSQEDVSFLMNKYFHKELVRELNSRLSSSKKLTINIGLNFIPFCLGAVKDIVNFVKDKISWVSLMKSD